LTDTAVTLKVLIVDDSLDDVLLLQRELRRGGYEAVVERVDDLASLAGALAGFTLVSRDITEQMRIAEERMQSQKLEVIGRLAGSVAHDFNNLLTIVSGFTELLNQSMEPDDASRIYLEEIVKATDQAAALTQQLLAFGRRQLLQPRVIDVNEIVSSMETMLRRLIGENVELSIRLEASPGSIRADAVQIQQAILNLVINARDAMPPGGTISIMTGNARETPGVGAEGGAGPLVTLVVADTGEGMDQQTLARIFEPFFTTKEVGKGSGLGLATVDGIVAQSGGRIRVSSVLNQGTTFTVLLPSTTDVPLGRPTAESPTASPTGSETVLLVEDEPALGGSAGGCWPSSATPCWRRPTARRRSAWPKRTMARSTWC
jgi:two-component system cell cycle sensor histidine kinase/response regulator CckA